MNHRPDLIAEARKILAGTTMMIASHEHLAAVSAERDRLARIADTLTLSLTIPSFTERALRWLEVNYPLRRSCEYTPEMDRARLRDMQKGV